MIDLVEIFPLLFTAAALLGGILLAKKNSWGWISYGVGNLMLLLYGAVQGSAGFMISPFLFWAANLYGLWEWEHKAKKRRAMREYRKRRLTRCLAADKAELVMLEERKAFMSNRGYGPSFSDLHREKRLTRRIAKTETRLKE